MRFIAVFMIETERGSTGFRGLFVKFVFLGMQTHRFDALLRGSRTLIRDYARVKVGALEVVGIALAGEVIRLDTVMRQDDFGAVIVVIAQPIDVIADRL